MEKLYKEPYDNPNLVKIYEERYIHHPNQKTDVDFEITVVERVMDYYKYDSWCDVACGTGHHLRKASGNFKRLGVDKSKLMMDQHKEDTEYNVEYSVANVLSWRTKKKFDLVTNFWFGYSHQPSLEKVLDFFQKMIDLTAENGSIVLSYHNNWKLFDKIPMSTPEPMGGQFNFDALQWSYVEPSTGDKYHCISPHKNLIIGLFGSHFKRYKIVDYPMFAGKELLVLEDKLWN
jgi:hypothetical protein